MRTCSLCDRGTKIGRNRSHAQNRTKRTFGVNVHKVTMTLGEDKISGVFCSKCLKKLKLEVSQQQSSATK